MLKHALNLWKEISNIEKYVLPTYTLAVNEYS